MSQYNNLNVKLSKSQFNILKSVTKSETDVILRLSSNMIGNSDDETNFSHRLLLTNRQVDLSNHTPTDIRLSKAQLTKM